MVNSYNLINLKKYKIWQNGCLENFKNLENLKNSEDSKTLKFFKN